MLLGYLCGFAFVKQDYYLTLTHTITLTESFLHFYNLMKNKKLCVFYTIFTRGHTQKEVLSDLAQLWVQICSQNKVNIAGSTQKKMLGYGQMPKVCIVLHWTGLTSLKGLDQRPATKLLSSQGHKRKSLSDSNQLLLLPTFELQSINNLQSK